jgi:type II secretory pathway predicted ATPase ExeA
MERMYTGSTSGRDNSNAARLLRSRVRLRSGAQSIVAMVQSRLYRKDVRPVGGFGMRRVDMIELRPLTKKQIKKYLRIGKQVMRFYGIKQKAAMHEGGLR